MEAACVYQYVKDLVSYGEEKGLVKKEDHIYITNRILEALELSEYEEPEAAKEKELPHILEGLLSYACEAGIIEDNITARDLFDTKLMGLMVPAPSEIIRKFGEHYKN
ncbi:MAG: galactose-1-phosphate uridylyltransferase, partial [Acetivibrio ethanolgignens]